MVSSYASIHTSEIDSAPSTKHNVKHLSNLLLLATVLVIACFFLILMGSVWWGIHLMVLPLLFVLAAVWDYRESNRGGYLTHHEPPGPTPHP